MIYNFDVCPDRRVTESAKWRLYPEDVLPLWVADMDFVSPEPVKRALLERVEHGIFGYPLESAALREIIVARMAELYQWTVQPDEIIFQPGVIRGFNRACHTVAKPGAAVLIQTPVYPPFFGAPGSAGLTRQEMQLTRLPDGSYAIDWDAFETAITPETRLFILCNPHNPVGRVFRRDELTRMAEICLRHEVLICSDEIHCDLLFPGHTHIPIASLSPEVAANTITLMAPSKTFNIAGLDCSFAIIQNSSLRRRYQHADQGLISGINVLAWAAALAAYRDGQEWLTQVLAYLDANRKFLADFVQKELPGIYMTPLEGTYLAWLDCRALKLEPSPYEFFLKQAHVALNDGAMFGQGGEGFVRLNLGCPRPILTEALQKMKTALTVP
jgi:cysteine-S-conjugate beta-lyase